MQFPGQGRCRLAGCHCCLSLLLYGMHEWRASINPFTVSAVAGDADFVPAAKLARREGIDFVLDPMWLKIPNDLNEHIDGLRSVCAKPK